MKLHYLLSFLVLLSISVSGQENGKDAVVSLPNLNVLYFGIPNPVQIAVPGVTSDKVTATITNGTINKTSNGWEVKPSTVNQIVIINVLVNNQKVSEKTFRVKPIPAPVAVLSGKGNGAVSKNEVINAGEIVTEMKDFLWDLKYEIKSYSFLYSENGNDKLISANGNKLTGEMKSIISNLQTGKNIIFKDIKAMGPDERIYDINPLILELN